MSEINLQYGVAFVQVPKTAGTSMRRAPFIGGRGGHQHVMHLIRQMAADGADFSDLFSFGFVRNPWDRFVSLFSHFHKDPSEFEGFVRYVQELGLSTVDMYSDDAMFLAQYHLLPQWFYLCDERGDLAVNFVGRYERLHYDWAHVCEQVDTEFDLPHLRKGHKRPLDYKRYYTYETWHIVGELYHEDASRWRYSDVL